ncbi:butyrophilin subfamily 1 member A1-like isoform X2 [Micropterus salmoides]|uniref:butyrophilin subfamily 1 member A1-like isoform X2 n=1 Tax=Micropterus salmoides TaxID=27706 RepID=UPI0018EB3269|nr:butyrophilin subfamily 1 member A1-like isoform X2 [Micropterus salmoides]
MTLKSMKLFPLLCLCLLTLSGKTFADEHGPAIIKVKQGSDVILPCSLNTKDIESERFEWKKDGQKDVFFYDGGTEDQQLEGRVSHFPDELQSGNASIIIRNTKVTDRGNYTCEFPHLQPRQIFNIELVVEPVIVKVKEGSDVILPCSLNNKENIASTVFDWKTNDQKEVFIYHAGTTYGPTKTGQDQQFKGRVSHFQDELQYGNASIIIRNTKVTDSGDYSCDFPRLQPRQIFHIQLVVGAAAEPSVKILNQTQDWSLLLCEVLGAFPKPTVEWQDSAGNKLPAEETHVSERGGSFYITVNTTVKKTDRYRCVATQEEIKHHIYTEIHVFICGSPTGWIVAVVVLSLAVVVAVLYVRRIRRKLQRERTKTEIALLQSNGIKDNASGQEDHDSHFPDKV